MRNLAFVLGAGLLAACSGGPNGSAAGAEPLLDGGDAAAGARSIPTAADLRAVWGSGRSDVWAVGSGGTILHFDGRAWDLSPSGMSENFSGIAGAGPSDVWVTSEDGTILHWNGRRWSVVWKSSDTGLLAIWALASTDVWAVGIDWTGGVRGDGSGYTVHWDGTSWQDADIGAATSLWAVWASGVVDDVWMVGDQPPGTGVIIRGGGTAASPLDLVAYSGPELRVIWGTGSDDAWLSPYQGPLEHWNGSIWTASPSMADTTQIAGVGGSGRGDAWAVGAGGVAYHYDGTVWQPSTTGTTALLASVWADGPDDAWAVGASGTAIHWDGRAWRR
jgi:hypothetical protein